MILFPYFSSQKEYLHKWKLLKRENFNKYLSEQLSNSLPFSIIWTLFIRCFSATSNFTETQHKLSPAIELIRTCHNKYINENEHYLLINITSFWCNCTTFFIIDIELFRFFFFFLVLLSSFNLLFRQIFFLIPFV